MAMSQRFREICDLLIRGTSNGRLTWDMGYSHAAFSTRLGDYLIALDRSTYEVSDAESQRNARLAAADPFRKLDPPNYETAIDLRILSESGDDLESISSDQTNAEESAILKNLWRAVQVQREQTQDARLSPLADALRATVAASH